MKLSSKTNYALCILINLSFGNKDRYFTLKEIARNEGLSIKFLEQVIGRLKTENLLTVKRGAKGGYRLSKSANDITLFDIYELYEYKNDKEENGKSMCLQVINKNLSSLNTLLIQEMKKISIADLSKQYQANVNQEMYYI